MLSSLFYLTLLNWPADRSLSLLAGVFWFVVCFCFPGCFVLVFPCFLVWFWDCDGSLTMYRSSPVQLLRLSLNCPRHAVISQFACCNMQSNVWNDLAEAKRRRTEKKVRSKSGCYCQVPLSQPCFDHFLGPVLGAMMKQVCWHSPCHCFLMLALLRPSRRTRRTEVGSKAPPAVAKSSPKAAKLRCAFFHSAERIVDELGLLYPENRGNLRKNMASVWRIVGSIRKKPIKKIFLRM